MQAPGKISQERTLIDEARDIPALQVSRKKFISGVRKLASKSRKPQGTVGDALLRALK